MENTLLIGAIGVLLLLLGGTWVVLYQVVKQQGRMLLRLDALEEGRGSIGAGEISLRSLSANGHAPPVGLAAGTALPPFELPDLSGRLVALDDFRGKRLFLVNWNPDCSFCEMIAPELAKLQTDFAKQQVQLMLVSRGTAEANRRLAEAHGLTCPILLVEGAETFEAFRDVGTPAAYLIDEEGKVAQPMALGAEAAPILARETVDREVLAGKAKRRRLPNERPLSQSRIEHEGLKAGAPAPAFRLPDIYGKTVALEEYRGRKVLLVFSDPHCGPCNELAPDLTRLHEEHRNNGLAVVMVGRGAPEANREKAESQGVEFPVALQRQWEVSKEYGIFATPVAFLIDEDGVIAQDVAKGKDAILAMAAVGSSLEQEVSHRTTV